MNNAWTQQLDAAISRNRDAIVAVRRHLHVHPEPSGEEQETSQFLYQLISELGLEVVMGPEGRGVVADPPKGAAPPRIALRADIDALRMQDCKTTSYRSRREGIMHACGHDAHTATVYGVLVALNELKQRGDLPWPVDLRAVFQPSEETATGAAEMIGAGVLEGIEAILGLHMDPTRDVGRIGIRDDAMTANCDAMRFTIQGRGGHAARPHESNDPIATAAQLISTLYLFVPRATDSQDSVVVTIGKITGGDNPNVIPERVELQGTLRTLDQGVRERTVAHIRQLARGIGETSGTKVEVDFDTSIHSVRNNPRLTQILRDSAADRLGPESVEPISRPSMGSEDFAAYLSHVPGAMFRLGCASERAGCSNLHTPTFDLDEDAIEIGAAILARAAVLWSDPDRPDGASPPVGGST